jgi:hypothetical protein
MIERAPLGIGLGCQRIELFGRREVFFPFSSHQLAFPQHVHELDASQRALCGLKGFESQHRACDRPVSSIGTEIYATHLYVRLNLLAVDATSLGLYKGRHGLS